MKLLFLPVLCAATFACAAQAENLLQNASFEAPAIKGRTPVAKGGSPAQLKEGETSWTSFDLEDHTPPNGGGAFTIGITDAIARTGKQSLFIDFEKLVAPARRAMLHSELVPIQAEKPYRISIWGRLDRQRPLALDERRPEMLLEVEYFAADTETQVGAADVRAQMIPGSVVPGLGSRILFTAGRWSEYYSEEKSPAEAAFMKVTWYWQTSKEAGETDGVIYFDDAAIEGERGTLTLDAAIAAAEAAAAAAEKTAPTAGAAPAPAPAPKK